MTAELEDICERKEIDWKDLCEFNGGCVGSGLHSGREGNDSGYHDSESTGQEDGYRGYATGWRRNHHDNGQLGSRSAHLIDIPVHPANGSKRTGISVT